uniref:Secreted protein n=1 Tax=Arundo donax TaxID=35708 RepID=A0A0A9DLI6_ARUDO
MALFSPSSWSLLIRFAMPCIRTRVCRVCSSCECTSCLMSLTCCFSSRACCCPPPPMARADCTP